MAVQQPWLVAGFKGTGLVMEASFSSVKTPSCLWRTAISTTTRRTAMAEYFLFSRADKYRCEWRCGHFVCGCLCHRFQNVLFFCFSLEFKWTACVSISGCRWHRLLGDESGCQVPVGDKACVTSPCSYSSRKRES